MSCVRCQQQDKFETTDYCTICLITLGLTTWEELLVSINDNDLEWAFEELFHVQGVAGAKFS